MLERKEIENLLSEINLFLKKENKEGEIILAGGAVMSLVYGTRNSTHDIDALFKPSEEMRKIIETISKKYNLHSDWLNDGVKGFFTSNMNTSIYRQYSNLIVYTLDAEAMLSLKLTSARVESKDQEDAIYLMKFLKIKSLDELYNIVDKYIPNNRKTINSHYFIIDCFEKYSKKTT